MIPVKIPYLYTHAVGNDKQSLIVTYWPVRKNGFIHFRGGFGTLIPGSGEAVGGCLCSNRFLVDENGDLPQHYLLSGTHTARPCQYAHLPPASIIYGSLQPDIQEHLEPVHTWAFIPLHQSFIQPRYVKPLEQDGYPRYPIKVGRQWKLDRVTFKTSTLRRRQAWLDYTMYMLHTGDDPLKQIGPEAIEKWGFKAVVTSTIMGLDLKTEVAYEWEKFDDESS
jgi:hypothetical protein